MQPRTPHPAILKQTGDGRTAGWPDGSAHGSAHTVPISRELGTPASRPGLVASTDGTPRCDCEHGYLK